MQSKRHKRNISYFKKNTEVLVSTLMRIAETDGVLKRKESGGMKETSKDVYVEEALNVFLR
jgi:hypothetical protein